MVDDGESLIAQVVLFAMGAMGIFSALRAHRLLRKVEDLPTSPISSAAQGLSEFQGFAWPEVTGPRHFDGRELIYYSLKLEKRVRKSDKKSEWVTVATRKIDPPFYLVDSSGLVMINVENIKLDIDDRKIRSWSRIPKSEREYLLQHFLTAPVDGFPPTEILFGMFARTFRLTEERINVGSPIYAHGYFETAHGAQAKTVFPGLTRFKQQVFDLQSRKRRKLNARFDRDGDGNLSLEEAERGYSALANERVVPEAGASAAESEREFTVFGVLRHSTEHELLVAVGHEEHFRARLQKRFLPALLFGFSLIAFGLAVRERLWERDLFAPFVGGEKSAPTRSVEVTDPRPYHRACVDGSREFCLFLVRHRDDFQLSQQAVDYYQKQGCWLGETKLCQTQ